MIQCFFSLWSFFAYSFSNMLPALKIKYLNRSVFLKKKLWNNKKITVWRDKMSKLMERIYFRERKTRTIKKISVLWRWFGKKLSPSLSVGVTSRATNSINYGQMVSLFSDRAVLFLNLLPTFIIRSLNIIQTISHKFSAVGGRKKQKSFGKLTSLWQRSLKETDIYVHRNRKGRSFFRNFKFFFGFYWVIFRRCVFQLRWVLLYFLVRRRGKGLVRPCITQLTPGAPYITGPAANPYHPQPTTYLHTVLFFCLSSQIYCATSNFSKFNPFFQKVTEMTYSFYNDRFYK